MDDPVLQIFEELIEIELSKQQMSSLKQIQIPFQVSNICHSWSSFNLQMQIDKWSPSI